MIVIAIIIILAAIAIPNYLRMTDRARRSRVAGDFTSLATANEAYLVDWGYYPMGSAITDEEFGKPVETDGEYVLEVTGREGAAHNAPSQISLLGEKGGIEYIKYESVKSMYNPFDPTEGYHYACTENGLHWVLWCTLPNGNVLYRNDLTSDLTENASYVLPTE